TVGFAYDYIAYERLYDNKKPILKCSNSLYLYTVSGSSKGNKALTNPIGLITADEVSMAGGVVSSDNNSYYLYTGQNYWTISPCGYNPAYKGSFVFGVYSDGSLGAPAVDNEWGVRPVINLANNVKVTGTGTSTDPYIVVGAE
ncbi:MAG: hypothetical protein HP057_02065, partial [Erysipelatoclostridium sp.]|nr:hypothetical protein [Thomasclavelia sp.]